MSRCNLDNEETGDEVAIGWDPPLNTFFAQVIEPGGEAPFIWEGCNYGEHQHPDALIKIVSQYGCGFDFEFLKSELMKDKQTNSDRFYTIEGNAVL